MPVRRDRKKLEPPIVLRGALADHDPADYNDGDLLTTAAGALYRNRSSEEWEATGGIVPAQRVIAFDTPGILATDGNGIEWFTLPAGAWVAAYLVSISEAWDGTSPTLHVNDSEGLANVNLLTPTALDDGDDSDDSQGSDFRAPHKGVLNPLMPTFGIYPFTGDRIINLVIDDSAFGDPGSTQGHAKVTALIVPGVGDI